MVVEALRGDAYGSLGACHKGLWDLVSFLFPFSRFVHEVFCFAWCSLHGILHSAGPKAPGHWHKPELLKCCTDLLFLGLSQLLIIITKGWLIDINLKGLSDQASIYLSISGPGSYGFGVCVRCTGVVQCLKWCQQVSHQ